LILFYIHKPYDKSMKTNDFFKIIIFLTIVFCFSSYSLQAQNDSLLKMEQLNRLSLEELMDIEVVTATGVKQKITEAPSTMWVITAQEIRERGYEQLDDVLRDIAGVDLIRVYGRAPSFITFRGMYGDENRRMLFMIDGVVENSVIGDFAIGGCAYSLHNVERIEILWGPGSALYGANAFGAVINIITKKGEEAKGLHFQRAFGSYNTSVENIMLGLKKSRVELALSGSLFNMDGPQFSRRDPSYSNSYVKNAWSFNGNISYTVKKMKTMLGARSYDTPGGWGEPLASPTNLLGLASQGNQNTGRGGMLQSDFNGNVSSFAEIRSRTTFLQNEYTVNSNLSFFARVQYRETELSDKTYIYSNSPGTSFVSKAPAAYYANRTAGELSANYSLAKQHQLSAGVQVYQDNLERGFREVIDDTHFDTIGNIPVTNIHATFKPRVYSIQNNIGTYLQYIVNTSILKKTNFTFGGRYDHNSVYGSTVNPRVAIVNQPNDKLTFKLLYGSAFRAPTNFELYAASKGIRIPNLDLKPERIQTYEANIICRPEKILSVQLNLFQNELRDVIIHDVPVGSGLTQNQNEGTASIKGVEAKMDIVLPEWYSAFLNFTYQKGTQTDGSMKSAIPNIATVKGNIGFSLYIAEPFTINIVENWVGDRSVTPTNPLGKVDGYFSTNLVLSANKLFNNRVSISIIIRNLLNQTYYDPGIRAADGNFYATVNDQPGVNGLLKISVSLY
jgi:outer membrane receptor for ferrienterochelin and colicins